jgi:hypothetical protein
MSDFKDKVLAAHDMNKLPYFKMYKGASATGNPIFISDEVSDFDQAHTRLANALNLIQVPGKYLVQFKESPKNNNNNLSYEFEVPYGYATSGGNTPAVGSLLPANAVSKDELATIIANERKNWEREQENKELKKQMSEMNAKIGKLSKMANPWTEALETFKPHLPVVMGIIQKWANPTASIGITGVNGGVVPDYTRTMQADNTVVTAASQSNEGTAVTAQQQELIRNNERLKEVIAWLIEVKGGSQTAAIDLLYCMMEKGKENPALIEMMEGFLK